MLDAGSTEPGYDVSVSQVCIGSRSPRVLALVHFLRTDLLPRQDFITEADLFLAL